MDGTGGHYVKWNKPDTERQVPYVFSHMWKLKKRPENRKVITRDLGGKKRKVWFDQCMPYAGMENTTLSSVNTHNSICSFKKNITEWVIYKEQKCVSHSSRGREI
jgi:hypothetical protein